MINKLLHTPEGVRDIYNEEYAKKLEVQNQIHKTLHLYGYRDIQTPTFEYFDIFNKEKGSVASKEMYKFFDREGETLVLRPDMTPSIARCAAKYYMTETMPIRLSYLGNTFINYTSYQGRFKEVTQTGAELIGDASSDADAEIIALVIDALKCTGLKEFQVELGQVDFFRGLVEEASMNEETEEQLRKLIENKNYFGIEALVSSQPIREELKEIFLKLPYLFGNLDQIQLAKSLTSNIRALHAIERLEKVYEILKYYKLESYVSFDLGMLNKYTYYTGIIFRAYTYGTGESIVTGGRYDRLLEQFGKKAPSVGFAIVVDQLLLALIRQSIEIETDFVNTMLLYHRNSQSFGIRLATHLRSTAINIQLIRKSSQKSVRQYEESAKENGIGGILYLDETSETIQIIDLSADTLKIMKLKDYMEGI